jgi:iron only hydrogenase large subunit-like protein
VMPCYDKKLEASREDFYNDVYRSRDVDCVITTGELEKMFEEKEKNLSSSPEMALDTMYLPPLTC